MNLLLDTHIWIWALQSPEKMSHHLQRRGRVRTKLSFSQWLDAAAVSRIELPQSDLGDIFLAATAATLDLTLGTSDSQLLGCRRLKTLASE